MPPEVYPVTQVARYLRELVEADAILSDVWIAGEISNYTLATSGHMYFNLKDEGAQIRCVFFRNQNMAHRQHMEVGASLLVHGRASVYVERGELQVIVDSVQPAGVGALQAEFERRRAQYEAEGLFDISRKRPLPDFPMHIGVVTSAQGAALQDILTVLARRWPLAHVTVQHATVQGESSANEISDAIRSLTPRDLADTWPDVLIVGRGGGSIEDLWAFNEDPVVRAIFACPVPVVSAVGHETDFTLADLVADRRAPTPSVAAEIAVPDREDVMESVSRIAMATFLQVSRSLAASSQSVDRAVSRIDRRLPETGVLHRGVAGHADRMRHAVGRSVSEAREQATGVAARLRTLSPLATLDRGYALVARPDGTPVPEAADAAAGDTVEVRWRDGTRIVRVESGS
ncbi:MAG: exodeoxyribonuclease VII large subunit [Chloroflexi bacterium]|nr:exodeoxyribonuclease VII large subunit [Chloroflexota bacterium]MQC17130.1 exodeoxyribonuclease VII large subunit [Chloroflexota bacterium]MQC48313.1 exodeoxyribonuclease VII large subunit [Chloroflexota bacterium]